MATQPHVLDLLTDIIANKLGMDNSTPPQIGSAPGVGYARQTMQQFMPKRDYGTGEGTIRADQAIDPWKGTSSQGTYPKYDQFMDNEFISGQTGEDYLPRPAISDHDYGTSGSPDNPGAHFSHTAADAYNERYGDDAMKQGMESAERRAGGFASLKKRVKAAK